MRHQQHGRLVGDPEVLEDRPQLFARELVERAKGLVEQQHARLVDQRAAQIGALKHAAGELPGVAVAKTLEADLLQKRVGLVAEFGLAQLAELRTKGFDDLERQHDVPLDRHPGQHGRVLERHADAQGPRRHFPAADDHHTGGWLHQPAHQPQDGGLAASGRPNQGDELALGDPQRRGGEGRHRAGAAAEGDRGPRELDRDRRGGCRNRRYQEFRMWLHAHHGWKCMQAECQRNLPWKSTISRMTAETSGCLLCSPALKLHAIEALDPCVIVIRERHPKHTS